MIDKTKVERTSSSEEFVPEFPKEKHENKRGKQCLWKICNWKVDINQKKSY